MISIVTLQPHEFTVEIALPVFAEPISAVPENRDVKLDIDYVVRQWQSLGSIGLTKTWAAQEDGKTIGLLGGLFIQEFWSGLPMGLEQFWFVNKASRRRTRAGISLFDKFEEEVKLRRCQTVWGGSNIFHSPKKMERFYASRGFELWGQNFRKIIKNE